MSTIQKIYSYIRKNGVLREKVPGSLGGIWGGDTWDLEMNGIKYCASLVDDGYTVIVRNIGNSCSATQTMDRDVEYRNCTEDDLQKWYENMV